MSTHYDTLGIEKDASEFEVRQAWRYKSRKHHPDREGGNHDLMAAINRAYEVLGDPERRANYDKSGADELPPPIDIKGREALLVVFMQCVEHAPDHVSLIADTQRLLLGHRGDHQKIVNDCRRGLAVLHTRKARLHVKAGENFLAGAIDQRIAQLTELMEKNATQVEVIDRACEMLKNYEYDMPSFADGVFVVPMAKPINLGFAAGGGGAGGFSDEGVTYGGPGSRR